MSEAARDRAQEGLDHLQAAARELIAAARAALDVAETLIDDPETMAGAVGAVGSLGGLLRRASQEQEPETESEDSGVQRITIS